MDHEQEHIITDLYVDGRPMGDIAEQHGLSHETVMFVVQRQLRQRDRPLGVGDFHALLQLVGEVIAHYDRRLKSYDDV